MNNFCIGKLWNTLFEYRLRGKTSIFFSMLKNHLLKIIIIVNCGRKGSDDVVHDKPLVWECSWKEFYQRWKKKSTHHPSTSLNNFWESTVKIYSAQMFPIFQVISSQIKSTKTPQKIEIPTRGKKLSTDQAQPLVRTVSHTEAFRAAERRGYRLTCHSNNSSCLRFVWNSKSFPRSWGR